jgi:hypothetical protein
LEHLEVDWLRPSSMVGANGVRVREVQSLGEKFVVRSAERECQHHALHFFKPFTHQVIAPLSKPPMTNPLPVLSQSC